ncbi:MAG: TonB-dependent receptor [Cyclobacteriaceae bacterium]
MPGTKISLLLEVIAMAFAMNMAQAQTIQVFDGASLQPIENVFIHNNNANRSQHTNHLGQADVTVFDITDTLFFRHPSYDEFLIPFKTLKQAKFRIALKEKTISISEIVISANKWEQDRNEIPNQILSIGPLEVALNQPQTAADVLAQSGQIFVQKSQLGGGSPMIRGFAANSVLIVVDGVRMNNAIFRSGNLQNVISIDPNILERTEVLFGPGSVIYGSDALGGTMNFTTRSPLYSSGSGTQVNVNTSVRYASANNEKSGHLDFSISGKNLASLTSFSFSDFDDLRTGSNRTASFPNFGKRPSFVKRIDNQDQVVLNSNVNDQVFSGYNQLNLLQKIKYKPGRDLDMTYTFNYSTTSDIPRYDRLIETDSGNFVSSEWFYGPQQWMLHSLKTDLFKKNKWFDKARMILSYQNVKESRNDRKFQSLQLRTREEDVDVYGINVDLEKDFNEKHSLFYGLEYIHNNVASTGTRRNILTGATSMAASRYPNGGSNYTSLASYINFKWKVKEEITLTGGMRYSKVWLNARLTDQSGIDFPFDHFNLKNGAVNGSIGLTYRPDPNWQINVLLSNGFRSPNIDDVGKVFDGANGIVSVPNPELGPEFSYNSEIGLSKTWGERVKFATTGFYSYLNDAIVRRDFTFNDDDSILFDGELSRVKALVNNGYASIYGVSGELKIAFSKSLIFLGTLTWMDGHDQDSQPLRHTTPLFGASSVTYRSKKLKAAITYRFNGKRDFEDLALSEQEKSYLYTPFGSLSWSTVNLNTSYRVHDKVRVSFGLENIFDLHYRPYSSGISAPGRNFIIAIQSTF